MATLASEHTSRNGGKRPGAGRKKQAKAMMHVPSLERGIKLPNDNLVTRYLLVLAAEFDEHTEGSAP